MIFTKQTLIKAARTFLQAAIAYLAVNITLIDFSNDKQIVKSALAGLLTSAVASGIAAVMNLEKKNKKTNTNTNTNEEDDNNEV